jgi:hypothetical protein
MVRRRSLASVALVRRSECHKRGTIGVGQRFALVASSWYYRRAIALFAH